MSKVMVMSGGGGFGPTFGGGNMNVPGLTPDGTKDEVYSYAFDATIFTKALLFSGYRPYQIEWEEGETEVVWARHEVDVIGWKQEAYATKYKQVDGEKLVPTVKYTAPDLQRYANAKITLLHITPGMGVGKDAVVIVHNDDGGYLNILGKQEQ